MGKVLHASYSGYFPTCILKSGTPEFPVSGSLEEIMSFYWRVRKFNVTFSGDGVLQSTQTIEMTGTFDLIRTYYVRDEEPAEIFSEEELVCNLPSLTRGEGGSLLLNGGYYAPLICAVDHFPTPQYYQLNNNARIQTNIHIFGGSQTGGFILSNGYENNPDYEAFGLYNINVGVGILTGSLYGPKSAWESGSFNMAINATEYWSYGGTYDTSTGQPL